MINLLPSLRSYVMPIWGVLYIVVGAALFWFLAWEIAAGLIAAYWLGQFRQLWFDSNRMADS